MLSEFRHHIPQISYYFFRIFNFRKKISKREICRHLVSKDYPVYIDKVMYMYIIWFSYRGLRIYMGRRGLFDNNLGITLGIMFIFF